MAHELYDDTTFPETPSEEDLESFKQQVGEWLKLDDQIKKLMVAVRERKVHQRAIASQVSTFMNRYGYDNLNTQQGRIRATTRTVKAPLRVTDIRAKLLELGDQPLTPSQIIERIIDAERPATTKQSLRRIVPKVSLHLDI